MDTSAPAIFPHETLELIFSFCDVPTLAAVGRVDSACLELSAPFLYEHIEITDEETYKLLFCESTPSTARVCRALSLSRVRTLAMLIEPVNYNVSRDRVSHSIAVGLKLDAFKILVKSPNRTLHLRPEPESGVPCLLDAYLHAIFSLFNPQRFLLVVSGSAPRVPWVHFAGDWADVGWDRLETVVTAGPASIIGPAFLEHREGIDFTHDHNQAEFANGFLSGIMNEGRISLHCGGIGGRIPEVWVESQEALRSAFDDAFRVLHLTETQVQKFRTITVNPAGHEGWWAEQKAKRKPARAIAL